MASRKGELRVKVISAKGLRDTAIFGIQDPYVQLEYGSLKVKTAVHRDGGTSPVWNESIKLSTPREAPMKLLVKVKNSTSLRDHRVGSTEVDLSDVFTCQHEQFSAPLFTRDGRQRGEVQLSISFLPADVMQASFTTSHSSPLQPQPHSPDTVTATPRTTSGACSSSTSKATTPAAESNLLNSELKGVPLPDQGDLGPLGKSLMALSMTHISPSKTRAQVLTDSNGMSHSSGTTRLSQDVGVTPHRTSPAAVASSSAISGAAVSGDATSHAVNAAPPKRNYYPEMIVEDEQAYSWAEASQSHHSNADTNVAAGSRLQQTADTAASVLAPGEAMGNASYSAQEVYAHQYALHATTASQHSHSIAFQHTQQQQQQQQHSPEPSWYSQGSDPRPGSFQQSGLALATQGTQARQGAPTQPYASHFHLLGTTPLHDGQHGQQLQHQSNSCNHNADPHYPPEGTPPQDTPMGQPAYLHQSYGQQAVQQTDAFRPVPAWRLAGTSPLHDGYGFGATEAAAIGLHNGGAVQPLTYAGMAVKSWSTQAKRAPVLPHRASNFDDSQSDLKVALSAPSAPSLPSFAHSPQPYALSDPPSLLSFANSSQPYYALSDASAMPQLAAFGQHPNGRPPLPSSAGQKGLPFHGLPTGPKFAPSGANRDRNAIV